MMLSYPPPPSATTLPPSSEPSPGARAAVLHAVEAAARESLGQPVALGRPTSFSVRERWAFVIAPLRSPGGGAFHYAPGTGRAEARAQGLMSHDYVALLSSSPEGWSVVATAVGPTDAVWATWASTYGAPAALFPRVR